MANGSDFTISIKSHKDDVLQELQRHKDVILEKWGQYAEGEAKLNLERTPRRIDTGALRNSIAHDRDEDSMYVGTSMEYGPYVEFGTGIHAESGRGRKTPWFYVDRNGEGHWTQGMAPNPFIRDSLREHMDTYRDMAKREFES